MTGDNILKKEGEKAINYFNGLLQQAPHAMPQMMAAVEFFFSVPQQIVIAGDGTAQRRNEFLDEVAQALPPERRAAFRGRRRRTELFL